MIASQQQLVTNPTSERYGNNLSDEDLKRIEKMHLDMREAIKLAMLTAADKHKKVMKKAS